MGGYRYGEIAMVHSPFRGPQINRKDFMDKSTIERADRLTFKERQRIQQKAEKRFGQLMREFVDFIQTNDIHNQEVKDKIAALDKRWREYCYGVPEMTPAGKEELMVHINKIIYNFPIVVTLGKEAPESAPPVIGSDI